MSEEEFYGATPPDLRTSIEAGGSGLALLAGTGGDDRLMLVCAAPSDRLDALTALRVTVGAWDAPSGSAQERLVVLSMGPDGADDNPPPIDGGMCVGIDIGDPEGRSLAARMAEVPAMVLVKVASETGRMVAKGVVTFDDPCSRALQRAVARGGEWYVDAPSPIGFSNEDWGRLLSAAPRPRLFLAESAGGMVMASAAAGAFRGIDLARRPASVASSLGEDDTGLRATDADLELRFTSPLGDEVRIALSLRDRDQRVLAARLCEQPGLVVLSLEGEESGLGGCVRLDLTPATRDLLRRASAAAAARQSTDHGPSGPG